MLGDRLLKDWGVMMLGEIPRACQAVSGVASKTGVAARRPQLWVLVASVLCCSLAHAEDIRFVPQLGLTDLKPVKVAFSPRDDSLVLVVNKGGRIDVLDVSTPGRPIKAVEIWAGATDAAFSPDGTHIISGGKNGTVRLWTLDGHLTDEPFAGHDGGVASVVFSPDGTRVVSGGEDGTVRLWTLDGQPTTEPFEGHDGGVASVAFSPDGTRIVSGGDDGTVRLWTPDGQLAAKPFVGHHFFEVESVAFSPDGMHIVSGGADGTVCLWTLGGEPAAEPFEGHGFQVESVAFSPDGTRVVSGGADGTVRLWTLDGRLAARPFQGHRGTVASVAFSPDGTRIVSAGDDGTVRLWSVIGRLAAEPFEGGRVWRASYEGEVDRVESIDFSPDGTHIASGGEDGKVRLWTLDGQLAAAPFRGHRTVESVAFSPDGTRIVSGGDDVRLWNLDGRPAAEPFEGHDGGIWSVGFSPDGTRIVSGGRDGTVRLWNLDGQPAAEPFRGHDGGVWSVDFSPGGTRIVSGGKDGTVRLWTLDGQLAAVPFKAHDGGVWSVAFSPDGNRIASGGDDGTVRLWTLDGQPAAEPFEGHGRGATSVAFSPDGTRIVSGGTDERVRLWTLDGQLAVEPLEGHVDWVSSVDFSPDGTRIASGGYDGKVRLWSLEGEQVAQPIRGHTGGVERVAFSPDGTGIVSAGRDGTVRLWTLDGQPATETLQGDWATVPVVEESEGGTSLLWRGDRAQVLNSSLEPRGQIFLHPDGWVAITDEGVRAPTDELHAQVRAIGEDGTVLTRRGAVPALDAERARQILFDDFTLWERAKRSAVMAGRWMKSRYEALGWFQVPFWPALAWVLLASFVFGTWAVKPHEVAHAAMPAVDAPELPRWRWLAEVVSLVGLLGSTRRALRSWAQRHQGPLSVQNFSGRRPVQERKKYCDLSHTALIEDVSTRLSRRDPVRLWIQGPGGTGKSALAYALLRRATVGDPRLPVPVLVDEDWGDDLLQHVARLVRPEEESHGPTRRMVRILGANGHLCVLLDSLTERGIDDAEEQVAAFVRDDLFRAVVVTSRSPRPSSGKVWEAFEHVEVKPLSRDQIPAYIATYAPEEEQRSMVVERLAPLLEGSTSLSPLYLRFAIERALEGKLERTSWDALVLDYLERLREERIDLGADDMIRACRVAAIECLRDSPTPRELEASHLRGALAVKADELSFVDAAGTEEVKPAALVEMLVSSGVLNRNRANRRFVQFSYDPVAEQLAGLEVSQAPLT